MTDLASLDAIAQSQEEGTDIKIKHPVSGEPIGLTIRVVGYESERVRKVQRKIANARLKNQRRKLTAEELEKSGRDTQVAAVVSWAFDTGVTLDGETPECTPDNVERVLKRFPFIARQIDDVADDASAFLEN